ncbi:hypothetical protein SpiGrapes_1263 [Sphaerochaeta pleomorpha str. Grapes]|uniref:ABC-2 family transporter protein n=1 Tax=Sphaerochaeta pleomorpha (strain ATCC BAA-1885 / DSM 22778 / Grapes) TaxID=158190 RepID=G8QTA9_SPHPG|nr:hypothetical protein [Sphaerochaeta pleomorpha]AEV29076.1 hypothetical protein SpiGrapes_1263 [Sphaerochaeta pleomorpha str. Grapes]
MRFLYVANREIQTRKKELAIYAITVILIMLVNETASAIYSRYTGNLTHETIYSGFFPGLLFVGGFILTSLVFVNDMFSKEHQNEWLMLPATSLEKFLAKGILTAFAYPVALILVMTIASVFIEALMLLFFGSPFTMFNPLVSEVGSQLAMYFVWQSVFLLGATLFHKAHFIKTVLALFVLAIVMGLLGMLFARIFFPLITGISPFSRTISFSFSSVQRIEDVAGLRVFITLGKIIYYAVLPLFCWVTAYFKVEEVQATDAV